VQADGGHDLRKGAGFGHGAGYSVSGRYDLVGYALLMETLLWALGILVTIQLAAMSWFATQLWGHVTECRQLTARLGALERDVERMKQDIGTHDTGIRGAIHRITQLSTAHELRIATLERS